MKLVLIVSSVLALAVGFFSSLNAGNNHVQLEWNVYSGSSTGVKGFLYELSNVENKGTVYISVDKELNNDSFELSSGWEINKVTEGELWNPRVCAKMPLTIAEDGDVFMYETKRTSAGRFNSQLIWFERSSLAVQETTITFGDFIGRMMFNNSDGRPYFLLKKDKKLVRSVINDEVTAVSLTSIGDIADDEELTVELREMNDPIIKIYNTSRLESRLFKIQDKNLVELSEVPLNSLWSEEDDTYTIHRLGLDFDVKYRPGAPYETKVLYKNEPVLSFIPESKIYSFVLGAY